MKFRIAILLLVSTLLLGAMPEDRFSLVQALEILVEQSVVVDTNGVKVGEIVAIGSADIGVLFDFPDTPMFIMRIVSVTDLTGPHSVVFFTALDCVGPVLTRNRLGPMPGVFHAPGRATYLIPHDPVTGVTTRLNSMLMKNGLCVTISFTTSVRPILADVTAEIGDYQAPFRVVTRDEYLTALAN